MRQLTDVPKGGQRAAKRCDFIGTSSPLRVSFSPCDSTFLTMAVPRSRIVDLMKVRSEDHVPRRSPHPLTSLSSFQVQCRIFNTVFNPTAERTGNKVLRQRLKGPSFSAYYPRRVVTFKDLQRVYPQWEMYDEAEEDRTEHVAMLKARGKGAPKKAKSAAGELQFLAPEALRRTPRAMVELTVLVTQIAISGRRGGSICQGIVESTVWIHHCDIMVIGCMGMAFGRVKIPHVQHPGEHLQRSTAFCFPWRLPFREQVLELGAGDENHHSRGGETDNRYWTPFPSWTDIGLVGVIGMASLPWS